MLKRKRHLWRKGLFALAGIATTVLLKGNMAFAADVVINETNFPDKNFRSFISENLDDGDGILSESEISSIRNIGCGNQGITSLQGIEYFTSLAYLYCDKNQLSSLDVSGCKKLQLLYCGDNQLSSLNVSGCTPLYDLQCFNNQLESLDVSGCRFLRKLYCFNNQFQNLDVSNRTTLIDLQCYSNQLTSLNISGCMALEKLYCYDNQLSTLDVSDRTALYQLICNNNQLTGLNISGCMALKYLNCQENQLSALDVSNRTALIDLQCCKNQLTSLNINGCTALQNLDCQKNKLSTLDVSDCTELFQVLCNNNQLTGLKVSGCTALKVLNCHENQLSTLDVSDCANLFQVACYNNQLTGLNISGCMALKTLNCYNNKLSTLDVSDRTVLASLNCYNNQLTSLNANNCTALASLNCYNNQMTNLNVNGCTALTSLICFNNQLSNLNVSNYEALELLMCDNNQLTSLNVSGCKSLNSVSCYGNELDNLDISDCECLIKAVCKGEKKNYTEIIDWHWDEDQQELIIDESIEHDDVWDYEYSDSQEWGGLVVDKSVELITNAVVDTSAPEMLSVASGDNGVIVTWKANAGVTKYAVFRKTDSGKWTKIVEVSGTSYQDGTAAVGHTYGYTVRGIDATGKYITSYDTKGKSVTISAIDTSAPVVLGATNGANGVTVSWKANAGVTKYVVFRKTDSGKWTKIAETTGNGNDNATAGSTCSYVDGTAAAGHTYAYTVRGIDASGKYITSYDTEGKSVTIAAAVDTSAPVVLGAVSSANGVTVTWKANAGVTKYAMFRKTDSGKWVKIAETTGNGNDNATAGSTCSYVDGTASAGHTYAYTVRGINEAGKYVTSYDTVGKSVTITAAVDASAPVVLGAVKGANGVTVTWKANAGVSKYAVFRKTDSGKWTKIAETTGNGNTTAEAGSTCSYVDGTVEAGHTYDYTVRGINAAGKYITSFDATGKSVTVDGSQQEVLDASSPVLGNATAGANGITLTWTANSGVPKYAVFRKVAGGKWMKVGETTGSGDEAVKAAVGSTCSYADGTAVAGTTYIYTVRGLDESGKYVTNFDANGVSATIE